MTPDEPSDTGEQQTGAASVADEAMRLAEAFAVWAQNSKQAADASAADGGAPEESPVTDQAPAREPAAPAGAPHGTAPGCDCAQGPAVEAVCRMCPVCRLAGLVQAVQPDLLDRVADLLGVLASGLRTTARERRVADTPATPGDADGGMDVPVTGGDDE